MNITWTQNRIIIHLSYNNKFGSDSLTLTCMLEANLIIFGPSQHWLHYSNLASRKIYF